MRRFLLLGLVAVAATAKANAWEACFLAGLACLTAGLWQVWPPLAWIGGGALLLAMGLWGARAAAFGEAWRKARQQ